MDRADAEAIIDAGKEAVIVTLRQQCEQIEKLEKLVASLRQNSTNSSKPPSSDGPGTKKKTRKRKSRKKQGAQPGHKGKKRTLLPADTMDAIHDRYPEQCEECGNLFADDQKKPTEKPARYQWFELPPIKMIMEEFRCHTLTCTCGRRTTASLPKHVAISCFGPRLHAAIAYLNVEHRVSKRGITEIVKNFFNLDIALGSTCSIANRVSDACKPVAGQIRDYVVNTFNLNIDETGWKNRAKRIYLWCFVGTLCVFFHIADSRGSKVLKKFSALSSTVLSAVTITPLTAHITKLENANSAGRISSESSRLSRITGAARMPISFPKTCSGKPADFSHTGMPT